MMKKNQTLWQTLFQEGGVAHTELAFCFTCIEMIEKDVKNH